MKLRQKRRKKIKIYQSDSESDNEKTEEILNAEKLVQNLKLDFCDIQRSINHIIKTINNLFLIKIKVALYLNQV